jgi:energy-coupling factor transporter ATP-binding protein EcfA2
MFNRIQIPLGYDKQSAQAFGVELKTNPTFLVVGSQKSGKTTLIKTMASTFSLLPNAAISVVGGSDLCAWARKQGFKNFTPTDPTLNEHLTGLRTELGERLLSTSSAAREDSASNVTSKHHQPLVLFIDDVDILITQGDKNVLEALSALSSDVIGTANIFLAVSISHARFKENSLKQPIQNLTKQKRGFMLQGKINECDPFSVNVSYAMKSVQLPTGEGYYTQEGQVFHLVLPFSDEGQGV